MIKHQFLNWMAQNTKSCWCNDSAVISELNDALESGAIGCTSNPPLTYEALTRDGERYTQAVAAISPKLKGDDRIVELLGVVVRNFSQRLMPLYESSNGEYGYIRSQVQPKISNNAAAMYRQGRQIATFGPNVMVKIPGTGEGMQVLEELAADGSPTNPTVCPSVSQIVAAAEAHERGIARARAVGKTPAPSTAAIVMGRLQDYLGALNEERKAGLTKEELDLATLAVVKRCHKIVTERGYTQILMPAAFRAVVHVTGLAGGKVHMTIHPKIQAEINQADAANPLPRREGINDPDDQDLLAKVARALPEFSLAYELDALKPEEFGKFGATVMTLDGFDKTGWQKLATL